MNQFMAFVRKEFYHIFRDKVTTAILLVLPILLLLLFGYAISTEVRSAKIGVYDPSNDNATRYLVEQLQAGGHFTLVEQLTDPSLIEQRFKQGRLAMVVVFSPSFESSLNTAGKAQVELITDGTDPNNARTLVQYASNILTTSAQTLQGKGDQPPMLEPVVRLLYNPMMKGAYNYVPGVMGMILMLICAMMTSISIAREKEQGTMELLLVSPMHPLSLIVAKTVPYFLLSLVNLATILLLSVFLLNVPITGSLATLLLFSLIYLFVNLALGLLISSVAGSQLVALLFSGMVLMIPVIMLSGIMFPVENMPDFFRWLSHLVPAKWYIQGVRKVMIMGVDLKAIWLEMSILTGMAILLITASLKTFKDRLN
jgi:ABC-2 type transport system permease protein